MINPDKIQIFELSNGLSPLPQVIIRYNGYDTPVSKALLHELAFDYNRYKELIKDKVSFYKEAIKYEQYIDFEMV